MVVLGTTVTESWGVRDLPPIPEIDGISEVYLTVGIPKLLDGGGDVNHAPDPIINKSVNTYIPSYCRGIKIVEVLAKVHLCQTRL